MFAMISLICWTCDRRHILRVCSRSNFRSCTMLAAIRGAFVFRAGLTRCVSPSLRLRDASLMKDLDGEAAGSGEVEGPGPVHVLRFAGLYSCRLQPVVDFIHPVVGILHEADMKPLRIGDLVRMVEVADREYETGVIGQYDIVVRRFSDAVESDVSPIHRGREG